MEKDKRLMETYEIPMNDFYYLIKSLIYIFLHEISKYLNIYTESHF